MARIWCWVLVSFALAVDVRAACAQENDTPPSGLTYLHASVAVGAELSSFNAGYDLNVSRRAGDWDRVLFDGERAGPGALLSGGLGFRLIPQLTAGALVEFSHAEAPLEHALLEETGARFDPTLNRLFAALFADARGRGPWHGGLALGYVFLRETMLSPNRAEYDHGLFGVQLFGGYLVPLGGKLALDPTLRATFAFEGLPHYGRNPAGSSDLATFAACIGLRFQ